MCPRVLIAKVNRLGAQPRRQVYPQVLIAKVNGSMAGKSKRFVAIVSTVQEVKS